jgi:hypothetical protein
MVIAYMFALNIGQAVHGVTKETWIYSLTISITYPAFLYLYSKYVTVDFDRFKRRDYLHAMRILGIYYLFSCSEIQKTRTELGL